MARCPKCGRHRFRYELRSDGTSSHSKYYRTGVKKSWILPAGKKRRNSKRRRVSVGFCPDCGYIEEAKSTSSKIGDFFATILGFLLIIAAIVSFISGMIEGYNSDSTDYDNVQKAESVWALSKTPIEDFEYYIEDQFVYLKSYRGNSDKVMIGTQYEINEETYATGDKIEALFASSRVNSVIIPEGIKSMESNIFNGCRVKYLYLPKSLEDGDDFYTFFHDVEKIYYGGSKEEWGILTNNCERSDIDVVEIIYDSNVKDLLKIS